VKLAGGECCLSDSFWFSVTVTKHGLVSHICERALPVSIDVQQVSHSLFIHVLLVLKAPPSIWEVVGNGLIMQHESNLVRIRKGVSKAQGQWVKQARGSTGQMHVVKLV
jgi:hypothetical protein